MTENLADMVKDVAEKETESKTELDINNTMTGSKMTGTSSAAPAEDVVREIPTSILSTWFEANHNSFENINHVKVSIRGIDPHETLIFSVLHPDGGKDKSGNENRKLRIWDNANSYNVLNIPAVAMEVFNNGFMIVHDLGEGEFLKCYGVRTGLNIVFCKNINGALIPYAKSKLKKSDSSLTTIPVPPDTHFEREMATTVDKEGLQLEYRQIQKHIDEINVVSDAITWFLDRQTSVADVNHLLQLDSIIIGLVS